ncbi:hypothetical protein ACLI4U_06100 [Natrialbaceae archaeon A-CW2]|uniref:DUF7139 domain-containing protein n=1 Tax=Natronosalvus amylolyticus TaxID=2961994 RepID=UPI0020C9F85A|nr:hypothetical protein [Natronosalvus amylolyticus]
MTSLTEVYDGTAKGASLRRLYAGTALVAVGAILSVVAVLVATTDLFSSAFADQYGPVLWAGVLSGTGVPLALLGVFTVLPASRRIQAAAVIGTSICLLGVALFWHAYPAHWRGHGDNLTMHVSVVYLLGLFTAMWCLFTAVVNFKTRNDPGGMLEMNVTRRNQTKVVEVESQSGGFSSMGFFGNTPDGDVETQTNDVSEPTSKAEATSRTQTGQKSNTGGPLSAGRTTPASDGGAATNDISSPLDDTSNGYDAAIVDGPETPEPTDRYCGNCRHFDYVRSNGNIIPYCGRFDETMDDMDACQEWTPNRNRD